MALRARAVSASTADQQNAAAGKQFLVPGEPVRTNRTAFGEIQNTKVYLPILFVQKIRVAEPVRFRPDQEIKVRV
jgi:hypothetical protein